MFETIKFYRKGMKMFDVNHPNSLQDRLDCFTDEWREFTEEPSIEEFFDCIHAVGRAIEYVTGIWFFCLLAYPTVRKHAKRVEEYGCPRSKRNCCGKCRNRI